MEGLGIVWEDKSWLNEEHKDLADKFIREYLNSNLLYVPKNHILVADLMSAERAYGQNSQEYNQILVEHKNEIDAWVSENRYSLKSSFTDTIKIQDIFPKFESYIIKEPGGDLVNFFLAEVQGIFQKDTCDLGKFILIQGKDGSAFQFHLHGNFHSMYFLDDGLKILGPPISIIGSPDGELELMFDTSY
jgi:hypothetical protein